MAKGFQVPTGLVMKFRVESGCGGRMPGVMPSDGDLNRLWETAITGIDPWSLSSKANCEGFAGIGSESCSHYLAS